MGWYREVEDLMGNNICAGDHLVTGYIDAGHNGGR